MTALPYPTVIARATLGLLVTGAVAITPSLLGGAAVAEEERPACSRQDPPGNSGKKCPSPSPSPSPTATATSSPGPTGTEVGCRDIVSGQGQYRAPVGQLGSVLEFQLTLAEASCPEVTYTVIARDMDTLAELDRREQSGNGLSTDLLATFSLPTYSKQCIAVDVVVSEGGLVHDIAPDSRDPSVPSCDLNRNGTGPQTWS